MAKSINDINLLPKGAGNFSEILLNWTLNIGRLLIILTEALALSVFLYRFSLDMRIVDLNDAIKQQSAITKNFESYEAEYRSLQERLRLAEEYNNNSQDVTSIFSDIIEAGRNKVTFNNILVSTEQISISTQSQSAGNLNSFIENIKHNPKIDAVSIDNIDNKTSTATIGLRITAKMK